MGERVLRQIGPADLLDTYKSPNALGDVVWEAPAPAGAAPQRWPLFHPSGAARTATLRLPGRPIARPWSIDLLEHEGAPLPVAPDGSLHVDLPAWGLATVRVELEER